MDKLNSLINEFSEKFEETLTVEIRPIETLCFSSTNQKLLLMMEAGAMNQGVDYEVIEIDDTIFAIPEDNLDTGLRVLEDSLRMFVNLG